MNRRPMYDMLQSAAMRLSLHMPGAQGRAPFGAIDPYALETTELDATDDLYRPAGAILQAQELAAQSACASSTLLLHGGSTAGVHAMLLYVARRGDTVILPRNVHGSAVHFCALYGLRPVFAKPSYTSKGRPYTTAESYGAAMAAHPESKAVFVVCPDFYGVQCDLRAIAGEAHARGMTVLCDAAHGAHFNWDDSATNAGALGADLFVQSAHKTLPALNAGAWLHAMAGVDVSRLRRLLRMVQTSSPSFVNMMALDDARAWMDEHGAAACDRLAEAVEGFLRKAAALSYQNGQDDFPAAFARDRLRLVLDAPQGGFALGDALAKRGIDVEMSDDSGVVCILSLLDGPERLERLYEALCRIPAQPGAASVSAPPGIPPRRVPLHEAAFAPCEAVELSQTVGRVCATQAGLYPPGVALLTPGEEITPPIADYLLSLPLKRLFGLNDDGRLNCIINKGVAQ